MNYPTTESLLPLIERLDRSYYDSIKTLSDTALRYTQKLLDLEVHQTTSQYVKLCSKLIKEIQTFVNNKKEHFLPYAIKISEKDDTGHDCTNCAGGCHMQHELQLNELKLAHIQLKDIISRVQMVSLPLYSETIYPDVYRLLRSHMALIENSLTELFSLEETRLIPRLIEAQKNINARD